LYQSGTHKRARHGRVRVHAQDQGTNDGEGGGEGGEQNLKSDWPNEMVSAGRKEEGWKGEENGMRKEGRKSYAGVTLETDESVLAEGRCLL